MSNAWRIVLIKRYSPNLQCHTIGCLMVLFGLRTDTVKLQLFAFIFHFLLSIISTDFTLLVQMLTRFMINYCSGFLLIPPKKNCENKVGQMVSIRRNRSMFVRANGKKLQKAKSTSSSFFMFQSNEQKKLRPWPFRCNYHQARAEADKQLSKVELVKAWIKYPASY